MEELPNDLTDDEFIEFVNQQNRFGFEKIPPEPETQPKNLADGLREWLELQAGRPLPEKSTGDEKSVYLGASWDENIEDYEKNHDWEKEKQELLEESARTPL